MTRPDATIIRTALENASTLMGEVGALARRHGHGAWEGADLKERRRLDDTITKNMLSLDGVTPAPGEALAAELRAYRKSAVKELQKVESALVAKCRM